jgi:hypothetical protein
MCVVDKSESEGKSTMYGKKTDSITERWENACFVYLRLVFERAPDSAIRMAAKQVYKYSPIFVLKAETVH